MQTATSETESKSRDLSICVHHYTLRAPCPKGQGKEAVRLSVEQVLTFFLKDSPQDDLWVRMTLLLERSQNQSRR